MPSVVNHDGSCLEMELTEHFIQAPMAKDSNDIHTNADGSD